MSYNVFMLSWEEISGRKFVDSAPTREEADRKVNELSETFPNAYFDYEQAPD